MSRTTIVIPNYNGIRHLPALFRSLAEQTLPPARVLLVDDGSTDDSAACAPTAVEVLPLPRNQGFARAVNEGIRHTRTDYVAILNNDVVLNPDWLRLLEATLDESGASFACPLLISAGEPGALDGAFDFLTRSGCAARALHGESDQHPAACEARSIQFPPMTAALFRRDAFQQAGFLNESFGSYYEDVEFGLRAALHQFHGRYVPQARATHTGSATLGAWSAASTYLIARNQLLLVATHYPPCLLRRWWWPILCGNLLFLCLAVKRGRGWPALRGKLDVLRRWTSLRAAHRLPALARDSDSMSNSELPLLQGVIERSESEWYALNRHRGEDLYWRIYFRLCRSRTLSFDAAKGIAHPS